MQKEGCASRIEAGLARAGDKLRPLEATGLLSQNVRAIIRMGVRCVDLASNRIRIAIDRSAVATWLASTALPPVASDADLHIVDLSLTIRRRGVERRLVIEGQGASLRRPDQPLIDMLARAHAYLEALTDGRRLGRKDVAERFGVHPEDVSRVLPLAFLSPRIVEAILTGQQPADLTARHLARAIDLPIRWADQSTLLGI